MVAIVLILGLIAVLIILYQTAQDVFKKMLGPIVSTWISDHPIMAVVVFIILAIAIGLLPWGVERLKNVFETRK